MKKNTIHLISVILALIFVAFGAYSFGWSRGESFDPTSTYIAPARVTEVDKITGWVTLIDWAGEAWCIRGENYVAGQLVIVTFNDNNTETIQDDLIVDVDCLEDIEEVE